MTLKKIIPFIRRKKYMRIDFVNNVLNINKFQVFLKHFQVFMTVIFLIHIYFKDIALFSAYLFFVETSI